jgi:hypothetical protein
MGAPSRSCRTRLMRGPTFTAAAMPSAAWILMEAFRPKHRRSPGRNGPSTSQTITLAM